MEFLLPPGIGDSIWALMKLQDIAARNCPGEPIKVRLQCLDQSDCSTRGLEFVRRFPFVAEASMWHGQILREPSTLDGYYNYILDGPGNGLPEGMCALMPNATLERGTRLERWMPGYTIDWSVPDQYRFLPEETAYAEELERKLGPYMVFYAGPMAGNTHAGHNRVSEHAGEKGLYWNPQDWADLGRAMQDRGYAVVIVGAMYDRDFYDMILRWKTKGWHDYIGRWPLGQSFAVIQRARAVVSYQCGLGIMATYWGLPTVMWWRPRGDSISRHYDVSFNEGMATAWVSPQILESGTYRPWVYGRETWEDVAAWLGDVVH